MPASFLAGQEIEVACGGLDADGAGVAQVATGSETVHLHIAGALPAERVRAQVAHVSGHVASGVRHAWAELNAVLKPSPDRVAPICHAAGLCGACPLMVLSYPGQLHFKRDEVAAQFAQKPELAAVTIEACVSSPTAEGYRNQAKYVFGRDDETGNLVLGAYGRRSHKIVDLAGCHTVEPPIERVRAALLAILAANEVAPFDEVARTGMLRYVLLRATAAGEILATLVAARRDWQEAGAVAAALAHACSAVVGVVLNVNPSRGNVLLGSEEHLLCGRASVEDSIGDVRVRLSSRSFFQVNREIATRIYRDVVASAPASMTRAVDVYAGAAGFALSLAEHGGEVIAIEENPATTAAAAAFIAEGPWAGRIRVVTGDAATRLAEVASADMVVLNPPRKGCAERVLFEVLRLRPRRLAYVSCNPETLARDLAILVRGGAVIERAVPYDMMPHTPHVETFAALTFPPSRQA